MMETDVKSEDYTPCFDTSHLVLHTINIITILGSMTRRRTVNAHTVNAHTVVGCNVYCDEERKQGWLIGSLRVSFRPRINWGLIISNFTLLSVHIYCETEHVSVFSDRVIFHLADLRVPPFASRLIHHLIVDPLAHLAFVIGTNNARRIKCTREKQMKSADCMCLM